MVRVKAGARVVFDVGMSSRGAAAAVEQSDGVGCEGECNCVNQTSCFVHSGGCPSGCAPGYTGLNCSEGCENGRDVTQGTQGHSVSQHVPSAPMVTDGCDPGYQGSLCTHATVHLRVILGAAVIALIICSIIVGVFLRRCRKQKAKDSISVSGAAAPSVGNHDRHEASRISEAGAFSADSHNGQASTSEPKPDRQNMVGDRAEDKKLGKVENMEKDIERKRVKDIEGDRVYDNQDGDHSDTAVPVETLNTYIRQHATDSHFLEEFSSVPMVTSSPRTAGISPQNVKKNRYKNIIPYNSTRVLLQRDHKKNQSDYINASYVKGYATDELYIASQAPSDRIINDFVRMIWEQRVDRVVMLTNLTEEGKKKCSRYWPVDGEEEFGDVSARLLTTHVFAEYTIRHLRLSKNGEPTRLVTQFHFTAWPDKSVPESPWGLVDFQQRVMAVPGSGPVLVHCSAGVGRTGTFIGLCNLLKEAEATGKMDFRSVLWKLRQDRMHTIQTAEQYAFLHKMALVGHMAGGTTFKVKDMYQRLAPLESDQDGATPSVSYRQEFEALLKTCDTTSVKFRRSVEEPVESVYQNMSSVTTIRSKDRLSNIVPNERYRAELRAETQHDDTYINAVFVPNLTKDGQDLLTQLPLPSTVTDFWRLVTQFNVGLVVAFDLDSTDSDDTIGEFLPKSETEPFENERYVVESRQEIGNSLVSEVTLTVHQKAVKILDRLNLRNKQTLTLLACKSKLLDPECALELHKKIKSCKRGGKSRVVYMCRNGADNSGLMCVHSILLDRLEADQCLTVPLVVGSIKAIRPQVIPTYDQYKCLYSILKLAHESQNVYGNVGDVVRPS
ncbi:hypothetical protein RRG08_056694 [Elysia crispata]|uniref:protein-tyrosine-phosphatase n=1 Tax=Elysia crispata TaxID=231223 RepID=A0AAE1CSF0_9GAST|nr:hypothetical protein RRG08_056694 [Elysia crispata]